MNIYYFFENKKRDNKSEELNLNKELGLEPSVKVNNLDEKKICEF